MNRIDRRAPDGIVRSSANIREYGPRNRTSGKRAWQLSIPQSLRRHLEAHGWMEGDRIQMDFNADTGTLTLKKKEKKPEKKKSRSTRKEMKAGAAPVIFDTEPAVFDHEGVEW
ncbi:MAG: hypothetical protein J7L32_05325 [Thermoplasmata archaeon]|nr:hypothetical protein [Thermoplasmata archaeon]